MNTNVHEMTLALDIDLAAHTHVRAQPDSGIRGYTTHHSFQALINLHAIVKVVLRERAHRHVGSVWARDWVLVCRCGRTQPYDIPTGYNRSYMIV